MIKEIRDIFDSMHFGETCLQCGARCCFLSWLPREECDLVSEFREAVETVGNVNFFLDRGRCKFAETGGSCGIYTIRPLDCRLFPLDIIEQGGHYYWCFYTICPTLSVMKNLLEARIQEIEDKIPESLWHQFKEQINISKEIYEPYKNKQYAIVREFVKFS